MTFHMPTSPDPIRSGDLPFLKRGQRFSSGQNPKFDLLYRTTITGSAAKFGTFPSHVSLEVQDVLMHGGRRPYSHQAEVSDRFLSEGNNVALITPTASGKTVSFLASILSLLQNDPAATAMMIYPMNALAADQMKVLQSLGFAQTPSGLHELWLGNVPVRAGVLNGDTPDDERRSIRTHGNLVITNHAALHHTVLAQSGRAYKDGSSWNRYLSNLRGVVIDEGHSYNGVEGTNAALAFRRLSLLAQKLSGISPQVIMASATIGNPLEHAENLTGLQNWTLVDKSGAASRDREFIVVCPDDHPSGRGRWSATIVTADLALAEAAQGRKVLIFCSSRNGTEKMADRINRSLFREAAVPFHAAIPAETKREFLNRILAGQVEVVCATSALELGVDIGGMDTVILNGHPGDHASFNQRAGRVGRTSAGRVILVLDENQHPINSYLEGNPEAIFWPAECRTIYPQNRVISTRHAACAFLETKDAGLVSRAFPNAVEEEVQAAIEDRPHARIAMVGLGNFGQFKALDPDGELIQELGGEAALFNWHRFASIRNAVGQFFRVESIDLKRQIVQTIQMDQNLVHTTPRIQTEKRPVPGSLLAVEGVPLPGVVSPVAGEFELERMTVGYIEVMDDDDMPQVVVRELDPEDWNPPLMLRTRGVQFGLQLDHPLSEEITSAPGGIQAVQDAMGLTVSLLVQARAKDVPVEIRLEDDLLTFFVFDMAEGGMGWADQLILKLDRWLTVSGQALLNCSCGLKGCPKCSLSPAKGDLRKNLAEVLLAVGVSQPE